MPHVIVKLWPGRSEEQKRRLANAMSDMTKKPTGSPSKGSNRKTSGLGATPSPSGECRRGDDVVGSGTW